METMRWFSLHNVAPQWSKYEGGAGSCLRGEGNIMLSIKQTWKASFAVSDDMWLKNKGLYLTLRVRHVNSFQGLV